MCRGRVSRRTNFVRMKTRCCRPPADPHRVLVWPYVGVSERAATVRNGDGENELEIIGR